MKPSRPPQFPPGWRRRRNGVALVIILAFVVIITGVILAFFSRAITNRSVSNASANETKVDLVAEGAADSVVGYLQQEIALSSSATPITTGSVTSTIYTPLTPASMLPQMSGTTASGITTWAPNFLIRSANNQNFYTGATSIPSNAINVSSTTPSLNGRSVSLARWNAHYFLPLFGTSATTDSTPITSGTAAFAPPDWVLVTRNGTSPTTWNSNMVTSPTNGTSVIGRYAYAIYNEGGLLDANVAGYPVGNPSAPATGTNQYAYKPALAYADLTQIGMSGTAVDALVAWRNPASALTSGSFQSPNFTQTSGSAYYNYVTSNRSGFLSVSATALNNNGVLSPTTGQSDRMFESRQELIAFMQQGLGLSGTGLSVLNYLATFTRGLNQPSVAPPSSRPTIQWTQAQGGNNAQGLDNQINPNFLAVRVSGTFTRNDGTQAVIGEPLVKKRFALSKLAWITYLGPSANRASNADVAGATSPGVTSADYDLWQLVHLYGIPISYLQQGTAANIQNYFGLVWQVDTVPVATARQIANGTAPQITFHDGEYKWFYTNHCETGQNATGQSNPSSISISATAGAISRLADIANIGAVNPATAREPDFFELLKAAACAGSKAQTSMVPSTAYTIGSSNATYPYYYQAMRDSNLDYSIIQLGANIIDQFKVDGYSTRIVFNDSSTVHEFRGVENLPYLYRVNSATLKLRMENPVLPATSSSNTEVDQPSPSLTGTFKDTGVGMIMDIPTIWNPHDENAPLGYPGPAGPGLPSTVSSSTNFRLIADSTDPDYLVSVTSTANSSYNTFYANGAANIIQPSTGKEVTVVSTSGSAALALLTYRTGPNGGGTPIVPYIQNVTSPGTPAPPALYPGNASLYFVVPNAMLFREPTPLAMAGFPAGSQLQMGSPISEFTLISGSAGKVAWTGTGFLSDGANPLNIPGSSPPSNAQPYVGICAALYPIVWPGAPVNSGTIGLYQSVNVALTNYNNPLDGGGQNITYRLQYRDPNPADTGGTGWVTYDEKYNYIDCLFLSTPFGGTYGNLADQADGAQGGDWESYVDPRTSRFAAVNGVDLENPVQTPAGTGQSQEWADPANGVEKTDRPDVNAGYAVTDGRSGSGGQFNSMAAPGWTYGTPYFQTGLLCQNSSQIPDNDVRFSGDNIQNPPAAETPGIYYADPDGVVRGAMGAYVQASGGVPAATTVGLPLATAYSASQNPLTGPMPVVTGTYPGQSRPYILHRPFHSVAELGYVFSGTPWKNIDFFTPQSGDAALLDVFTAYEPPTQTTNSNPLVAGVVNLNTQQAPVLQALLSNAYVDEAITSGTANTQFPPFSGTEANQLLTSGTNTLLNRTASTAAGQGPLQNISDLVGRYYPMLSGTGAYSGPSADLVNTYSNSNAFTTAQSTLLQNVDRFHEAFLRPLAAVGNTRVWNLMIDLIAQTGRYPQTATSPNAFMVDGEQRYWVHIAIDRYTGQVLDKQVEVVRN